MDLKPYIESTNLSATILGSDVDELVSVANGHHLLGVCVPPFWVKRASREIADSDLKLVTVVGFPFGFQMTETKVVETELAMRDGADEIDLVLHLTSFANNLPWTKIELAKISKLVHDAGKILKVIIEVDKWDEKRMLDACKLTVDAGTDFVKTATGINTRPADPKIIEAIRKNIPDSVGIKASGGIYDRALAVDLVNAGADRLGTSKALNLV